MKRYFSKGDWYDIGTEAFPLISEQELYENEFGLFRGTRLGCEDEEICSLSEFLVVDSEQIEKYKLAFDEPIVYAPYVPKIIKDKE